MTDQWVPAPPQPPAPPPPDGLPPANSWSPVTPCAAADSPSIADGVIITGRPAVVSAMPWQITVNDGGTPANFSIDHYDASGALIEHPIMIDGASGDVTLTHDPTQPLGVATKDYVDNTGLREAPMDNTTYGRDNGAWVPLPGSYMPEAPNTTQRYGRFNSIWQLDAIQTDAPSDGAAYARQNGAWTAAVTGGPYVPIAGGTMTGPLTMQGSNMIALNAPLAGGGQAAILGQKATVTRWQMMLGDQTAEGAGNAGSNFSLGAFSTTGVMLGTWLTIARADGATTFNGSGVTIQGGLSVNGTLALAGPGNFALYGGTNGQVLATNGSGVLSWATRLADAPSDGQFYTRQNAAWAIAPGGMTDAPNDGTAYARKSAGWAHLTHTDITDWTATLAPYALTTAVPGASTTIPLMDGTGAVGTGTTFARADHVHPTDTSRYAASNPSGFQTAGQVTASLANYLPLAGGAVTGATTFGANLTLAANGNVVNSTTGSAIVFGHGGASTGVSNVAGFAYNNSGGVGAIIEQPGACLNLNRSGSVGTIEAFYQAANLAGTISVTASATAYNTSSDVRLKTDAQSFDAGPILDATMVYNFEWTADGTRAYGVMAQEAYEVFPDAVHHDESADTWGVDYSKYVPLLLNEIKALRARVAALEAANG